MELVFCNAICHTCVGPYTTRMSAQLSSAATVNKRTNGVPAKLVAQSKTPVAPRHLASPPLLLMAQARLHVRLAGLVGTLERWTLGQSQHTIILLLLAGELVVRRGLDV